MAKRLDICKCMPCGNIVEVLDGGDGELSCCGEPMKHFIENTVDAAKEKHVPVIEKIDGGYKIKVGAVAHPMADEHYIAWVELLVDGKSYTQFLSPGNEPEATFAVDGGQVTAREYCTLHGLWKGE